MYFVFIQMVLCVSLTLNDLVDPMDLFNLLHRIPIDQVFYSGQEITHQDHRCHGDGRVRAVGTLLQ